MTEVKTEIKKKGPDLRKVTINCARKMAREMPLTAAALVWGGSAPRGADRDLEALALRGASGDCGFGPGRVYAAALKLAKHYEEDPKTLEALASLRASRVDQQPAWMLELAVDVIDRVLRQQKVIAP